jgi:hypothetical protein
MREDTVDAPFFYLVKFWIDPAGAADVLGWLDNTHMADVIAQPGFRWVRRVRLDQDPDDGWHAYMMIYGLDSRDALLRYFDSEAPRRYAIERKPFEKYLRTERNWGALDFSAG